MNVIKRRHESGENMKKRRLMIFALLAVLLCSCADSGSGAVDRTETSKPGTVQSSENSQGSTSASEMSQSDQSSQPTEPGAFVPADDQETSTQPNDAPADQKDDQTGETEPEASIHVHSYRQQTIAPTCIQGGYTVYSCECGHTYTGNETAPMAHTYTVTVVAPTEVEYGGEKYICDACGYSYWDKQVPPTVDPLQVLIFESHGDGTCSVTGLKDKTVQGLRIPEENEQGEKVVRIGNSAFMSSDIRSVIIPDTVTVIESYAFRYCDQLVDITLPGEMKELKDYVFDGCTALRTVKLPEGLTQINRGTFFLCKSLESVELPDSVTAIGDSCFHGCASLRSIRLPNGLQYVPYGAFTECVKLEQVILPDSVTQIGGNAFYKAASLESIVLPKGCKSIGSCAFYECTGLTTVAFGQALERIEGSAFAFCPGLEEVILPDTVQAIGGFAFSGCTGMKRLCLGMSIVDIDGAAFKDCTSLTSVFLPQSLLVIKPGTSETSPFVGCSGKLVLYSDAKAATPTWQRYFGLVCYGYTYETYLQDIA